MKPVSLRGIFNLKISIAVFTVALFTSTIWVLVNHLDDEVRADLAAVLSSQQYQTVAYAASSLDEALRMRIKSLADAASLIDPAWMKRPDKLHASMAVQLPLIRFFNKGIFVIGLDGTGLADLPNIDGREGANFATTDYFRKVIESGKPAVGKPVVGRFTKKPVIVIAVPIRNDRQEIIGLLAGVNQIEGSDLFGEVFPKSLQSNGDIQVISPKYGIQVFSNKSTAVLQPAPAAGVDALYDRYTKGFDGSGVSINSQGIETLSSAKSVPSAGWIVIASLPTAVAFEAIDSLQSEIYRDAAIASVLIALLLWFFLESQLSPLNRSTRIIDAISDGREPLRALPIEGSREIRRLLGSFNRLQKHIETQNRSLLDNAAQMRLTASVFEGTSEAILISSADNLIVSVNRAFCRMTGYDETELIGKNPRLLQSGRHDAAFYQEMWSSLQHTGQWQGEIWNRRKNGEIYPERLSISTLSDEAGNLIRYIALAADIAKQKQAESVIWQQANYDLLTFLPNRHLLQSRMHEAVDRAQRNGLPFAVLHIDLDHFSDVNSLLGHGFGDRLLIEVGNRISSCVGKDSDAVSHLGGDEFVVLINALRDPGLQEAQLAAKILQAISAPIFLGNETVFITASIGVAVYPDDAVDVPGLLVDVYQAKLSAKQEGGNRTCRQTAGMRIATQMRMQLANDLRGALAANQLEVYYQPVVDLASGRVIKAEALLRWHHPTRGMILPALFIPIAEETGLINEIGDWVFREAAKMAKRWCDLNRTGTYRIGRGMGTLIAAPDRGQFQVNINKSPRQFFAGNTEKTWIHYMKQNNIEPGCIAIEITEGLLLDHHPDVVAKLNAIREFGIELALDDFGTGYSSMSYLKRFDIDYLKIDRSFVQDIVTDPSDLAITEALIAMAHKLGMKVVAEGVETIEQRNLLADAGCDLGQGYFFAIPMPAAQFESLVFAAGNALHSKALLAGA